MNQKQIGFVVIALGIILCIGVFMFKAKEDKYINEIIKNTGSCYLSDGTCLHEGRDYSLYIGGWVLSGALIILGIYLILFDHTQKILAKQHLEVSSALKEAKHKDEFTAFLAGFSDDEQKVLKAIKEQDGIQQSTLRYRTGILKATLSLMLKSFEERGIISKKESGKTNQIFLKKKY